MYQTDKEKIDASTWGGAIAVASFEEHNVNLESILEFKVSNKNGSKHKYCLLKKSDYRLMSQIH